MEEGSSKTFRNPRKHSFFKVLIGDYADKLRIPVVFVYRFRSVIPKTVTLKASSNKCWRVDTEEENDKQWYFKTGWRRFVEDNGLETGEFIVFKYDGSSTFKVKIYDTSACEKEIHKGTDDQNHHHFDAGIENQRGKKPLIPPGNYREENPNGQNKSRQKRKLDHEIKQEKEDSDDHGGNNKRTAENEAVDDETNNDVISIEPDDDKAGLYEQKTMKREEAFNEGNKLVSKNPSFKLIMKDSYARKGKLFIPAKFFRRHMKYKKQKVEIETDKGKWRVRVIPSETGKNKFGAFSAGWSKCARENHFQAGQTLRFNMIQGKSNCPKFIVQTLSKKTR